MNQTVAFCICFSMIEIFVAGILLICGVILTFRLGFYRPSKLLDTVTAPFKKDVRREKDGISPFSALCTALGGCVGTGNIIGITSCIALGGIGSIFWIWLCSFLSFSTKYTEVYLSVESAYGTTMGSPFHYIRKFLSKAYMPLAYLWCILCLAGAVFTGASVQSNAISEAVVSLYPQNSPFTRIRLICGLAVGVLVFIILLGGLKRIASFASALVPTMCILYVAACIVCIVASGKDVLLIIKNIFEEAFSPKAAASGSITYTILRAMRLGVSRGLFSNEAGMGTSPLALSSARVKDPHMQGGMGIWEIIIDTFIICNATAIMDICCVPQELLFDSTLSPVYIVKYAFATVFPSGASTIVLAVAIILFAFTSILGWSYYGYACSQMLLGKRAKRIHNIAYISAFCIMIAAGSLFSLGIIWDVAATVSMIMALPNVIAMLSITKSSKSRRFIC